MTDNQKKRLRAAIDKLDEMMQSLASRELADVSNQLEELYQEVTQ